jgi:hypothetical protein
MGPLRVVVADVFLQNPSQMILVQDDEVIQAFPANTPNHSLRGSYDLPSLRIRPMFNIDYLAYNLVSVRTGVEAPNMNSIMERIVGTVRREALDNFLLTGKSQVQRILDEYVAFYNGQRPHQGLEQQIPKPCESKKIGGPVCKSAVLGGLHHPYYRQAA